MNRYKSNILSFRRWTSILSGLFLIVFCCLYFLDLSTKTEALEKSAEQNLVLGRLAYEEVVGSFSGGSLYIRTANADGTGRVGVAGDIGAPRDPSWSPDGTRIVYVLVGAGGDEIYVMNADGTNKTNLTNTTNAGETNPSWSATGKIVYERGGQIWTMNTDGSNQAQFAGITQPAPAAPAWTADGEKLAFTSGGEIWKINADGMGEQRVTTNATTDANPAWSPNGAKIVFAASGSGIKTVNADGTNETPLTNVGNDSKPEWSPDGTTIAFRRDASPGGIYVMDVNGGNQVRIIEDTQTTPSIFSRGGNPSWQPVTAPPNTFTISGRIVKQATSLSGVTVNLSGTTNATATTDAVGNYQFSGLQPGGNYTISPSLLNHYFTPPNRSFSNLSSNQIADFTASGVCVGTVCAQNGKIAFVRDPGEIYTVNSDGTDLINITNSASADTEPNYSPDGTKMIFTTNRDGNNEIYRMNANGSNPVRLTNNTAADISPYYSYDGASIVFISNRDGNNEIYQMNADGTNQVRLTNDTLQQSVPEFSPDGQKIIFVVVSNQLWAMNADGTNQQQFQNPPGASHYYNHPSYSPNGQKIIFNYGDDITTAKTWTMNADGTNRVMVTGGRSPSYSPDGLKVVGSSPFVPLQGIYTSNPSDPNSSLRITTDFDTLPDWQPISVPRRTAFDFDGDGRSDVSVYRPSNYVWYLLRSSAGFAFREWGLTSDVLVPADYDGDLKTDLAMWRPSDGNFYSINSFDNTFREENFGLSGDVPTGGDWDGDGKADVAVFREGGPQQGFHYRGSMGNPNGNVSSIPWGVPGDKPVAGDYDGDGRTDAAVFRPSIATWYVRQSSNGQLFAATFGLANDKLVPADYDGDGKTDIAVFRDGFWYLLRSAQGFTGFQFGTLNDIPVPADYDGDGRADAAIFRNGVWWILKSQSGMAESVPFGSNGDKPIPSAYVR